MKNKEMEKVHNAAPFPFFVIPSFKFFRAPLTVKPVKKRMDIHHILCPVLE